MMGTLSAIFSLKGINGGSRWTAVTSDVYDQRANRLARRTRRVFLLLGFLWILNISDLALTIWAHRIGNFTELNPIARQLLDCPTSLSFFKVSMIAVATIILITHRHLRLTEISCWGLCAIYTALSLLWMQYYNQIVT